MRLNPLIGRIMSLSLLLLLSGMMTACASTRVQEAQIQANAQITAAQTEAQARIGVAQAQADATKYASAQAADAAKYTAKEQTAQAGIYASIAPLIMGMLVVAVLAGIVLYYRGKAHLVRVSHEAQLLLPSPPPSPSRLLPPPQVTIEAQRMGATVHPGAGAGEWLLVLHDGRQLVMRPRQLTDSRG